MGPLGLATIRREDTSLIEETQKLAIAPRDNAITQVALEACLREVLSATSVSMPQDVVQIIADYAADLTPMPVSSSGSSSSSTSSSSAAHVNDVTMAILTPINKWDEASPFAGRVVAWAQRLTCYDEGRHSYILNSTSDLSFGYVQKRVTTFEGESYFFMLHLVSNRRLHESPIGSTTILNDRTLAKLKITMRLASQEELQQIRKAIASDKASFVGHYDEESNYKVLDGLSHI